MASLYQHITSYFFYALTSYSCLQVLMSKNLKAKSKKEDDTELERDYKPISDPNEVNKNHLRDHSRLWVSS